MRISPTAQHTTYIKRETGCDAFDSGAAERFDGSKANIRPLDGPGNCWDHPHIVNEEVTHENKHQNDNSKI